MRLSNNNDDRERVSSPDITPLVDVVFLLIIFFLTTSTLVRQTVAELDLPEQAGNREAETEDRGLVVNIDAQGSYLVSGETVGLQRVLDKIGAEAAAASDDGGAASLELLVRADAAAPMASLNALAAGLIDLGVQSWRVATRTPNTLGAAPAGGR